MLKLFVFVLLSLLVYIVLLISNRYYRVRYSTRNTRDLLDVSHKDGLVAAALYPSPYYTDIYGSFITLRLASCYLVRALMAGGRSVFKSITSVRLSAFQRHHSSGGVHNSPGQMSPAEDSTGTPSSP